MWKYIFELLNLIALFLCHLACNPINAMEMMLLGETGSKCFNLVTQCHHSYFMLCLSCLNCFCYNVSEAFFRKMLPLLFMCNSKKYLSLPRLKVKINTSQTKKGTSKKITQTNKTSDWFSLINTKIR